MFYYCISFFAMFSYFLCMYIFLMIGLEGSLPSRLNDQGWFEGLNKLSPQPLETPFNIYLLSREDVWSRKPRCRSPFIGDFQPSDSDRTVR